MDLIKLLKTGQYVSLEAVNAEQRTWRMIPLGELEAFLHRTGLGRVLQGVADNEQLPAETRHGAADFLAFVASPRVANLDTTDPDVAAKSHAVVDGLLSAQLMTPEQAAQLWALGGGLRVPEPVTPEAYQAALDQIAREQQRDAALADVDAARNQYAAALDAWVAEGGVMPEFGKD